MLKKEQHFITATRIPKGVDFDDRTADDIVYIENWINNYPRRLFKFKTSKELFEAELANLA